MHAPKTPLGRRGCAGPRRRLAALLLATLVGFLARKAPADEPAAKGPEAAAAPATVAVARGPWGGAVEVKGALVAREARELEIRLEAFRGELKVVESFPGGSVVAGQVLLRADPLEIDRAITDAERDLALARVALEKRRREEALAERERALGREEALRGLDQARTTLERFEKVERALRLAEAEYNLEGTRIRIEQDREELAQLEKMVASDDLTEETEEIVVKRTRRALERLIEHFERQKLRHEWFTADTLPRQHEELRLAAHKAALRVERLDAVAPLDDQRRDLELAKAEQEVERKLEALEKLRRDREALTLRAPAQGVALAAVLRSGVWEGLELPGPRYRPETVVRAGQPLYTFFEAGALRAEGTLKEGERLRVRAGQAVTVHAGLAEDSPLQGQVEWVAEYGAKGAYGLHVRLEESGPGLRAGVSCTLKIAADGGPEVLSVPATCLGPAEGEGAATLYVVGEDGPRPVVVKVGRRQGGRVEILAGVDSGAQVLERPPPKDGE